MGIEVEKEVKKDGGEEVQKEGGNRVCLNPKPETLFSSTCSTRFFEWEP